jgi:hypothetical protein
MNVETVITHLKVLETDTTGPDREAVTSVRLVIEHLGRRWDQGDVTAHTALRAGSLL